MALDIKREVLRFIQEEVIGSCLKAENDAFFVLVVDYNMLKMISSVCNMLEINRMHIGVVLNIDFLRDKLSLPAIYIVEPSEKNLDRIIKDFGGKTPLYKSLYLFINGHINNGQITKLKSSKLLSKRIKALNELDLNFFTVEPTVFSLKMDTFASIYGESSPSKKAIKRIANGLASFFVILKEFPLVRFSNGTAVEKALADELDKILNGKIRKLTEWKYREKRALLLILSRDNDPVAPVMHEYTFKAMVADLIGIDGDFVDLKSGKDDRIIITGDKIWLDFSDRHIADAIKEIPEKSKSFVANNPLLKAKEGEKKSKNMMDAVRSAPEYKKEAESFNKNISIAEECMRQYKSANLKALSEFEQEMATGIDVDGNVLKHSKVKKKLTEMLNTKELSEEKKVRLFIIYRLCFKKKASENYLKLAEEANLSKKHIKILANSDIFTKLFKPHSKEQIERNKAISSKCTLSLMRFVPQLKDIVQMLCEDKLPEDAFPFLKEPPPEADEDKKNSRRNRKKDREKKEEQRIFVFVIGGATYSEMRSVNECSREYGREICIGGTKILTPNEFISELDNIKR